MLNDLLSAALGLVVVSKEKAEKMVQVLVEKGDLQQEEARKLVNRLIEKGKEEKTKYGTQIQQKIDSLKDMLVTREDLRRVEEKIDAILSLLREKQQ
jgi:polyhydroxyalkanoate synthesis regulator phasin